MRLSRSGAMPLIAIVVVAVAFLGTVLVKGWEPHLGLDLQGGASVVYQAGNDVPDDTLDDAIEIIRSRVDALGVAEPEIVRQGDSIVVNLPGIEDRDRALEVIGRTAELRFRPVLAFCDPSTQAGFQGCAQAFGLVPQADAPTDTTPATTATTATTAETTVPAPTDTTAVPATTEGALGLVPGENAGVLLPRQETTTTTGAPAGTDATTSTSATTATTATTDGSTTSTTQTDPTTLDACELIGGATASEDDVPEATVALPGKDVVDGRATECYVLGPVPTLGERSLVGAVVTGPEAQIVTGQWGVNLGIRGSDRGLFNSVASQCFNRAPGFCPTGQLGIVLDGQVQSAPVFNIDRVDDTGLQISGNFSEREARDLALVLRFGALPVELVPQTVQEVSATLGKDSLRAGLVAGLIGVALVAVYMLVYYRALGVVVLLGLAVWGSLNFAIISWLGETQGLALSLSGVTGIVVSVGVTVDSYVVYFERLKDEIRSGKTIRSSVDRGFQRAFRTILTADVSSFIGAFLLYVLTVGPVRGFAFFLGLSTLLDVVVAYFFTRPLVGALGRSGFFTRSRLFGVARGLGVRPTEART